MTGTDRAAAPVFRPVRGSWIAGVLGVAVALGGIALAVVFVQTAYESWDPEFGSGSSLFGVGLVCVIGIGILLLGFVVMMAVRARYPQFFREGLQWSGRDAAACLDEAAS